MQILFPKTMPLEAYTNWDIIEILRQNGRQDDALQDQVAPSSGPSIINQNASLVQLSLESNKSQAVPCIPGRRTINSSKNDLQEASSDPPAIVFAADSRTASEAVIEVNTSGNTLQNDAKNGAPTDPASDALKEEKKRKGIASFMHANMDKLPAALLTLSVLGLAAAHGSGKNEGNNIVKLNENLYEILCFGSIVGLHSGILLYGYSAYYKETETTDDLGFKILSYVALGASAYLLLVFCIILVSLERGNQAVIVSAAVTVALIYALVWPFRDKHKTLLGLMKERWDKRKARIRDQRPELPRTSTGVMGRLWSGSRS
uniref:Uncharacterized protein n=1 Tax=Arundo donax TaxID=35708 RepID=A0A0A9H7D4_ARUDO